MILLDLWDLSFAALAVLLLGLSSSALHLGIGRSLAIAALRTTLQLFLIGLVLKALFSRVDLLWVGGLALVMLLVAGREVQARQQYRFQGRWGYGLGIGAMLISSFSLTLFALWVMITPEPWYAPQYAIPLLGMLLGNTMNGIALSLDRLTESVWRQRALIEGRLCQGERWQQAINTLQRDAMRSGMMPMINAMAAAGIVSLPGMMTGQILAGSPPLEAVKYQILIMFLITAGSGFGTLVAVWVGSRRLFDERQRLRIERLRPGA